MRITQLLLKKAPVNYYKGRGEEFKYWKRYLVWEKIRNFTVSACVIYLFQGIKFPLVLSP